MVLKSSNITKRAVHVAFKIDTQDSGQSAGKSTFGMTPQRLHAEQPTLLKIKRLVEDIVYS